MVPEAKTDAKVLVEMTRLEAVMYSVEAIVDDYPAQWSEMKIDRGMNVDSEERDKERDAQWYGRPAELNQAQGNDNEGVAEQGLPGMAEAIGSM